MSRCVRNPAGPAAAFTLVEVLVASTVFILLVVLFAQVVVSLSQTAVRANSEMDVLGDARQTLDTFAQDWNARVRRLDVSMQAAADPTTKAVTSLSFLTQVRSYSGTRQLATVSYQMDTTQGDVNYFKLTRGTLGYNWLGTGTPSYSNPMLVFPTATASTPVAGSPTPLPSPGATPLAPDPTKDYELVSDSVFHVAFSFLTPTGFSTDTSLVNSTTLRGVVVTLAVLDQRNRKIITSTQLGTLCTALDQGSLTFPSSVQNAVSPLTVWQQNLNTAGFAGTASVPPPVAAAVRIYQRVFYLQE